MIYRVDLLSQKTVCKYMERVSLGESSVEPNNISILNCENNLSD